MSKKILLILALVFSSSYLSADQLLESRTVSRFFAEGVKTAGFYTTEGLTQCKYQIMYIDLSTETDKSLFSMVMLAKSSKLMIQRMDYSIDSAGACRLSAMHLE